MKGMKRTMLRARVLDLISLLLVQSFDFPSSVYAYMSTRYQIELNITAGRLQPPKLD